MPFTDFDALLQLEYGGDFWSEDALLHAMALVGDFQPADWDAVRDVWAQRSSDWIGRLIDALSSCIRDESREVLQGVLYSDDEAVAIAAALGLAEMATDGCVADPSCRPRVQELADAAPSEFDREELRGLLRHMAGS